MSDDPTDEAAFAGEWGDGTDRPGRGAPGTRQLLMPRDPSPASQAVNAWVSDHMIVASVLAFAGVCLIVAAGDAAFGTQGIWFAIEAFAVLICARGAYLSSHASASGDLTETTRFKRQALGGAFMVLLIAIRIVTKAY